MCTKFSTVNLVPPKRFFPILTSPDRRGLYPGSSPYIIKAIPLHTCIERMKWAPGKIKKWS